MTWFPLPADLDPIMIAKVNPNQRLRSRSDLEVDAGRYYAPRSDASPVGFNPTADSFLRQFWDRGWRVCELVSLL